MDDQKFSAALTRYQDLTKTLRAMTTLDLHVFGGYITLQVGVGAWLLAQHTRTWPAAVGFIIIDLVLAALADKLLHKNYERRSEIVTGLHNVFDYLEFGRKGAYFSDKPLDEWREFKPWWPLYRRAVVFGFVGLVVIIVAPLCFPTECGVPTMLQVIDWLNQNSQLVIAAATLGLALFAGVQISLEVRRRKDTRRSARIDLTGPAWLARRSIDAAYSSAAGQTSARGWFDTVGVSPQLDRLEAHVLETLRLASVVGGREAEAAQRAFEQFLAFADNVNRIGTVVPAIKDDKGFSVDYTTVQRQTIDAAAQAALGYLKLSADSLDALAPRLSHEPQLPPDADIPLLGTARPQVRAPSSAAS